MDNKPNLAHGIYRLTHSLLVGDKRFICESDMIVIDDTPYVVLEWGGPEGNQYPATKVELDWSKLHPPSQDGHVGYDGEIIDPRPLQ
jgi:hypothetical protein